MKTYEGEVTFSTFQRHPEGGRYWRITIEDRESGTMPMEVEVGALEFASALSNLANQPCRYEVPDVPLSGARREVKTEVVLVPDTEILFLPRAQREADVARLLAPYEVDGWRGRPDDVGNMHKRKGSLGYVVTFVRFVESDRRPVDMRTRAELLARISELEAQLRASEPEVLG